MQKKIKLNILLLPQDYEIRMKNRLSLFWHQRDSETMQVCSKEAKNDILRHCYTSYRKLTPKEPKEEK